MHKTPGHNFQNGSLALRRASPAYRLVALGLALVLMSGNVTPSHAAAPVRRVNAPHFDSVPFTTESGYRWESDTVGGINNNQNNRGWYVIFHIPFASLGLAGPPPHDTLWGMAMAVHDRDDAVGTPIADSVWPGVPWTWDISYAVAQAYTAGQPLRLALRSRLGPP